VFARDEHAAGAVAKQLGEYGLVAVQHDDRAGNYGACSVEDGHGDRLAWDGGSAGLGLRLVARPLFARRCGRGREVGLALRRGFDTLEAGRRLRRARALARILAAR